MCDILYYFFILLTTIIQCHSTASALTAIIDWLDLRLGHHSRGLAQLRELLVCRRREWARMAERQKFRHFCKRKRLRGLMIFNLNGWVEGSRWFAGDRQGGG